MARWIVMAWFVLGLVSSAHGEMNQGPGDGHNNYTQAFWKLYTDALRGDMVSEFQVGVMYERGLNVGKNEAEAAKWYEKSANQGYVDAQYNLAIMYASGRGVRVDDKLAMMWLAAAAKAGDKESRALLLEMIDGKIKTEKEENSDTPSTKPASDAEVITPVTLICQENSVVCSEVGREGKCTALKNKTVVTSKEKQGKYYKISGIVVNHQWREYEKIGWIEESSVKIRR